ncbi:MAG TPA: TolC family protein [Flavipsychrobacter sp.]|nr:TolC family protein [Flavipsychrobacter sp.]
MKHRTLNKLIALSFSLFTVTTSMAQTSRSLSLDEAITLTLQNSNELKLSGAKIKEASAAAREARERRLPDFKLSGSYIRLTQPDMDLKVKLGSSSQQQTGEGSTTAAASPVVNQAMYGIANVSLPLFTGFKIQYGIEAAKYLEQAARLDAEKDRDAVIQNTVAAYSNLYKAKAALELVKENLKQSEQRVKDFTNLEKNGLMARNDLLKAQLQQSNVELTLVDAQNNYELSSINMNLMLGLPENTMLVAESDAMNQTMDAGTFENWQTIALQHRTDAAALQYREKAAGAGVKAAKGDYFPNIALTGGYIAAHIPNFITLTNALNGGVGFSYSPSSLWKNGAKVAQAKAQLEQVQINRGILSDAIRLQVAQAYQSYLSMVKKLDVYEKAVQQASENYRITKNKYDNSLATTTDLLDADVAQLQAKINQTNGKADAMVAYKKLLQTTGILYQQP